MLPIYGDVVHRFTKWDGSTIPVFFFYTRHNFGVKFKYILLFFFIKKGFIMEDKNFKQTINYDILSNTIKHMDVTLCNNLIYTYVVLQQDVLHIRFKTYTIYY